MSEQITAGCALAIVEGSAENAELEQMVATLQIQMAELQTMVFGKKCKPPTGTVVPVTPVSAPRTKVSYRRPFHRLLPLHPK